MAAETKTPLVDACCPVCCRACDLNSHDYCLPCATSPYCNSAVVDDTEIKKPPTAQSGGNGSKKVVKK